MFAGLFPFFFHRNHGVKDELCGVIHICAGIQGMWATEPDVYHSTFIVTLQNNNGARGKIDLGIIDYKSPWLKLEVGDKILVSARAKVLFPLEMKIVVTKEIYHKDSTVPVMLAA